MFRSPISLFDITAQRSAAQRRHACVSIRRQRRSEAMSTVATPVKRHLVPVAAVPSPVQQAMGRSAEDLSVLVA